MRIFIENFIDGFIEHISVSKVVREIIGSRWHIKRN